MKNKISKCPICGSDLETDIYADGRMSVECTSGNRCIDLASKDHTRLLDLLRNTDWREFAEVKSCPQCGGDEVEFWFDDDKFWIHCTHPRCWKRGIARGATFEEVLTEWKEIVRDEPQTEKEETMNYKLFSPNCEPEFHGDWIDLKTRTETEFHTGDLKKIPLGIAIQLPEGHEAMLTLRSSTPLRYGIMQANAPGIIDEKYCGDEDEIQLLAYAFRSGTIPAGTRVAQMRIFRKQENLDLVEVKSLGNANRRRVWEYWKMKVYANYLELKEEVLELVKHLYAHQLWIPVYKDDEYHPVGRMEAGKDISGIIRYTSLSHRWLSGATSLRNFTVRPFLRLIPQPITLKEEAFEEYQRRLRKDWEYAKNTIIPHFQREDKP